MFLASRAQAVIQLQCTTCGYVSLSEEEMGDDGLLVQPITDKAATVQEIMSRHFGDDVDARTSTCPRCTLQTVRPIGSPPLDIDSEKRVRRGV